MADADRERLIEILKLGSCPSPYLCDENCKYANLERCYEERTADLLLEHGVIVLPCKVGDRLYEVTGRKTVSVYKVRTIRVELFSLFIEWDIVEGFAWQSLSDINAGEIGKTVFLTREEAERALKEREDNG
ncbi:MAG: hypothetical protein ACLTDI_03590 [Acutalibacteraceae bacterium]|nr:MAG TPA: hypothetical protein [Caudoviricetes sp.]